MTDELFHKGNFGLERETLRIDSNGRFADTPHPFPDDEHISKDYGENQLEIITPICRSIDELMQTLANLDRTVRDKLVQNGESLWLYSNPPHFDSEDDIIISIFTGPLACKSIRYEKLTRIYGKRFFILSGVHFNFSFDDEYLHSIHNGGDFEAFKFQFYLRLYKQLFRHSWLPVILTAASPICDRSMLKDGERGAYLTRYASIRNGERGHWNKVLPILSYASSERFVQSLEHYVNNNLSSISELALPVRLKPKGYYSVDGLKNGVSHIEFRMPDVNPLESLGIDWRDLEFIHLLTMYLSTQEDFELTEELQIKAIRNHQNAALYDLSSVKIEGTDILMRAKSIIEDMRKMFDSDNAALHILEYEYHKLDNRLCTRLGNDFANRLYPREGEV